VSDGSFSLSRAKEVATWLFVDNPKRLFGLERFLNDDAMGKTKMGVAEC
jgi:hypothetical protein